MEKLNLDDFNRQLDEEELERARNEARNKGIEEGIKEGIEQKNVEIIKKCLIKDIQ